MIAYYGRFSRSALSTLAYYVNRKLRIMRKFKRFKSHKTRASLFVENWHGNIPDCSCIGRCSERNTFA